MTDERQLLLVVCTLVQLEAPLHVVPACRERNMLCPVHVRFEAELSGWQQACEGCGAAHEPRCVGRGREAGHPHGAHVC